MSERLTPAQRELLAEVEEVGVLYVTDHARYGRTIRALERKGLVVCVEPDYSRLGQNGWSAATGDNPR